MPTYIMLTRRPDGDIQSKRGDRPKLGAENALAMHDIAHGKWDHMDIFRAPDLQSAMVVSTRISLKSGCKTELWPVSDLGALDAFKTLQAEVVACAVLESPLRPGMDDIRAYLGRVVTDLRRLFAKVLRKRSGKTASPRGEGAAVCVGLTHPHRI
jgi:hypothetical protein